MHTSPSNRPYPVTKNPQPQHRYLVYGSEAGCVHSGTFLSLKVHTHLICLALLSEKNKGSTNQTNMSLSEPEYFETLT
jgi:hypothetical protein